MGCPGVELPLAMPASPVGVLVQVPAALFLTQLPANPPGKALEHGPSTWAPAAHVRDQDLIPGTKLCSGPALAVRTIWSVKQWLKDLSVSLPLSLCCSAFPIK